MARSSEGSRNRYARGEHKHGRSYGFYACTAEADFWFDEEIPKYIEEMYRRGLKLWAANREKKVDESQAQLKWFIEQYSVALAKFKKYLNIGE